MTLDATQVVFATTIDTFKNLPTSTGSISVPSQSYTSGQVRSFTTSIDLVKTDAVTLMLHNYSFDSLKFYIGTNLVLFGADSVTTNFQIVTQGNMTGATLNIETLVLNVDVSSHSVPAFTVDIEARRFATPFVS